MGETGGNGTATTGELQRWLNRVDREQQKQWSEIRHINVAVTSIEAKLDQLIERRQNGDGSQQDDRGVRFEQLYGVWRFLGQALATAVPAGLTAGLLLIAYLRYSQ